MLGTLVNTAAVLVGSCIGLLFRKGLPERFGQVIMKGLGLCVMYIGIKGALKGENEIIAILSVAVGAVIGELLRLDERLLETTDARFPLYLPCEKQMILFEIEV